MPVKVPDGKHPVLVQVRLRLSIYGSTHWWILRINALYVQSQEVASSWSPPGSLVKEIQCPVLRKVPGLRKRSHSGAEGTVARNEVRYNDEPPSNMYKNLFLVGRPIQSLVGLEADQLSIEDGEVLHGRKPQGRLYEYRR